MTAPTRKVRMSSIEDAADPTPYADFSGSAYAPDVRVAIEREVAKRRPFVTRNTHLRECLAEFLATTIAIAFGLGGIAQSALWNGGGDTMTVSVGWGVAVMVGTFVADSASGAQIISVITVTNAVYGRMPWWK
uniref:Aquaporin n=1 Tax=Phytophthora ramorum TaxID=164328 RepID=H3H740_PHYRM